MIYLPVGWLVDSLFSPLLFVQVDITSCYDSMLAKKVFDIVTQEVKWDIYRYFDDLIQLAPDSTCSNNLNC